MFSLNPLILRTWTIRQAALSTLTKHSPSSIFVSHSRRDPANVNMAYTFVSALRSGHRPDGSPICRSTSKLQITGGCSDLWLDKEQLVAGPRVATWQRQIAQAQAQSPLHLFFLSSTWVASQECMKELQRGQRLGKQLLPVILEDRPKTTCEFSTSRQHTNRSVQSLSDTRLFADWQCWETEMKDRLSLSPTIDATLLRRTEFTCSDCCDSRDWACPRCANWMQHRNETFLEPAYTLGSLIDAFFSCRSDDKHHFNTLQQPRSYWRVDKVRDNIDQPADSALSSSLHEGEILLRKAEQEAFELSKMLSAHLAAETPATGTAGYCATILSVSFVSHEQH